VIALSYSKSTEAELLLGVIEARPAAVAELFDRYLPTVRRLLIRTLGNATDIDDLVQETFLAVIRRASTLRDPSAFSSFVGSFAIRLAKNELRRRALRRFIGLGELEETHWVHDDPLAREGLQRLDRALNRLDSTSRILFVLRHVEELELTEIAKLEGVSLATIKRRIARAERAFEAVAQADPVLRGYLERSR
jgi:RNA polymerase sigma-70 factor (ECF subfamily)